jgi:1-acyl-sn-glycerol-3-phosphate acyltransferase
MRLIRLSTHFVLGMGLSVTLVMLRISSDGVFYQRLMGWWLRKVGHILGAQVSVVGEPAGQGGLLVANHISWLDIPLLGGLTTPRFLSKQEVRTWPVVGWLADKAGTLFITRGKAGAAAQASATMLQALRSGRTVLLFPEGTTTAGNGVGTFHARLFASALDAGVPVQPVAVRYPGNDGKINALIPYVEEQSLWDNLKGILGERVIAVEIHFLPPITSTGMERKALAALCEQSIRAVISR